MTLPWRQATFGLAVALAISLVWGARIDHLRSGHKIAREQLVRDFADAQRRAQTAFDAQVAALQTYNRRLNDAAQTKSDDLRLVYRDRVIRLPAAPAACSADRSDLPSTRDAALTHRPGGDTVLLERRDVMICATNTARLQAARDWALDYNQAPTAETTVIAD